MKTELRPPTSRGLKGSSFVVVGLGRAGTSISRYLLRAGAVVFGWDENDTVLKTDAVRQLEEQGLRVVAGLDRVNADWAVVSPGISDRHPAVKGLNRRGVAVVDELDLAARLLGRTLVVVTGTNGKSTTTTLIALMLRAAGRRVFFGGNLAPGRPLSSALGRAVRDCYVVEASSFQLARARWLKPRVAVVLNITPDHLNWHRTMGEYAESKFHVLDHQTGADFAVLNRDDERVFAARARGDGARRFFSTRHRVNGAYFDGESLCCLGRELLTRDQVALPGAHNLENALAASLSARLLGVGVESIRRVLGSFRGLPHRLERVAVINGIAFINNSMSTNPAAAVRSLEAVAQDRGVVLIAGGREKNLPVEPYVAAIKVRARWAVLTGENRHRLARRLRARGFDRLVEAADLGAAVNAAVDRADRGDAVLFSPGFASFDQFRDFQARGDAFRAAVRQLRRGRGAGR